MMGALIGLLAPTVGEKAARPVAFAMLAVLLLAAVWGGKCAYDRSVIAKHEQKAQLEQAKRERKADENLHRQIVIDNEAAAQRQAEIDHATKGIPDRAPSERQRRRACLELVRQAKASGSPIPAC